MQYPYSREGLKTEINHVDFIYARVCSLSFSRMMDSNGVDTYMIRFFVIHSIFFSMQMAFLKLFSAFVFSTKQVAFDILKVVRRAT